MIDSEWKEDVGGGDAFSFNLSISNRSDADNSVATAELILKCRKGVSEFSMHIPCSRPQNSGGMHFLFPARLDSHQTISGWVEFKIDPAIIKGAALAGAHIAFTDSHGSEFPTDPFTLIRRLNEAGENL